MTRHGVFLFLGGALVLVGMVVGAWWPAYKDKTALHEAASLKAAFAARTLTLRPDGCIDLRTDGGHRSFIFVNKVWRACPKK